MTTNINYYMFLELFEKSETYKNNFSRSGLSQLFDYLEKLEETTGIILNIDAALICDKYAETTEEEYKKLYNIKDLNKDKYILAKFKNYQKNNVDSVLYKRH